MELVKKLGNDLEDSRERNNRRMVDAVEREEMISCCDAQQK